MSQVFTDDFKTQREAHKRNSIWAIPAKSFYWTSISKSGELILEQEKPFTHQTLKTNIFVAQFISNLNKV
jgi:hypothetical protein